MIKITDTTEPRMISWKMFLFGGLFVCFLCVFVSNFICRGSRSYNGGGTYMSSVRYFFAFFQGLRYTQMLGSNILDGVKGQILWFDFKSPTKPPVPVKIEGNINPDTFSPHGISSWRDHRRGLSATWPVTRANAKQRSCWEILRLIHPKPIAKQYPVLDSFCNIAQHRIMHGYPAQCKIENQPKNEKVVRDWRGIVRFKVTIGILISSEPIF